MTDKEKDLFDERPEGEEVETESVVDHDPADQLLDQIVDENGKRKYASVDVALNALKASQEHIKRLETETAQYREKLSQAEVLENMFKAIKKEGGEPAEPEPKNADVDVKALVVNTLKELQTQEVAEKNASTVSGRLRELYGDKARDVFYQKAKEAGLEAGEINALARKSPTAVFKLLGIEAKKKETTTPAGINTAALETGAKPRTPRSAMSHGSTKDLVESFTAVREEVTKRLSKQ